MKGLPGLIRLHQWKLDECRRALAALEILSEDFRRQIAALDSEIRHETAVAQGSPEAARTYGSYLAAARTRRQRLEKSLGEVVRQIGEAHGAVTREFQELRRYQLAHETRERRQAQVDRRQDQIRQDEVGLNQFRRRG